MHDTAIFWFTNDLRLTDNAALQKAAMSAKNLLCVYCVDIRLFQRDPLAGCCISAERWRFLRESIAQIQTDLKSMQQTLCIRIGHPEKVMAELIQEVAANAVYRSYCAGFYENQAWQKLQRNYPKVTFAQIHTHTLFVGRELPFVGGFIPATFGQFRQQVAVLKPRPPLADTIALPPLPAKDIASEALPPAKIDHNLLFPGGWRAAKNHLHNYFSSDLPTQYKATRNSLHGWEMSTKLSPWLACGALSPRQVVARLRDFEATHQRNESTEWIYYELLWREYFQWYAHGYRRRLFTFSGVKKQKPPTEFDRERYQAWCSGNTAYPLVNACMRELNATGFLSNRARQIVASCFVNELGLDWRYGAAYFEQRLIDYDVASNWGNWQYLAGVGVDPRGQRHLSIDKQQQRYDPDGVYIEKWQSTEQEHAVDQVELPSSY